MEVGMKYEVLAPTVEHGEEANFRPEMFGISRNGTQGL
jgi:hypothetical protein